MKSKRLLLTLLLALLVPWAAQAQETLTVCDGTSTSSYAPIKGSGGSQTEFIYPASLLENMEGGTITSVKFFSSSTSTTNYSNTVTVFVEEVASSTVSSSAWQYNQTTATKVYEGTTLSVTGGELVITFSTPYEYNGGNLCFNIWSASSTPSVSYYYLATTNSCGYDYYITPPVSHPYSTGNYLPKAEFTYTTASDCPKPNNFVATDVTAHTAVLSWESDGFEFVLEYKKASDSNWTQKWPDVNSYTLTGLAAETEYQARVAAFHETCPTDPETGDHTQSDWREISFTTGIACPAPTNLAVTPESITAREATVTWEGSSDSYVVSLGVYDYTAQPTTETLIEEGFEDAESFGDWTPISGNVTRYSGTTHTGSYRLDFRGSTSNMIALPKLNVPTNTLNVEFWTRPESTAGSSGKFAIGYMTDIADASTFVAVETYNSTEMTTTYVKKTVDFSNAPHNAYIAFRQFECATYYYWYVDDVVINGPVYPINWTEYSTSNQTYTFENLTPNTLYQVKVKGNCGDEGYSVEAGPIGFTTLESCIAPTGLAIANGYPTAHDVSFTWDYQTGEVYQFALPIDNVTDPEQVTWNTTWYAGEEFPVYGGLTAETTRTFWLRKKCSDTDFSEPVYVTFTTLEACPAPTGFAVMPNSITGHTADLTWQGSSNVYYVTYGAMNTTCTVLSTGFEDNTIPATMTNSTTYPWTVTAGGANESGYCAIPGNAGVNSSSSDLTFVVTGPGTVSFMAKVSSESGYDYGRFFIDGSQKVHISGTQDWTAYEFELTAGTHTLIWRYYKDSSTASGNDLFYVDDINVTSLTVGEWQTVEATEVPFTLENLLPETPYQVTMYGDCENEGVSTVVGPISFTTDVACQVPTGFALNTLKADHVILNWAEGADAWQIQINDATTYTDVTAADVTINEGIVTYTLNGLTENTAYTLKLRANCGDEDGFSAWTSALSFTTLEACPQPTAVNVSNIEHYSATVNWTGESESFTVKYRTAGHREFIDADFENGSLPTGWTNEGETDKASWTVGTGDYNTSTGAHNSNYNALITYNNHGAVTYLVTPAMDLSEKSGLNLGLYYINRSWAGDTDGFGIYYRIDGGEWIEIFATTEAHGTWTAYDEPLPAGAYAANCQIGFKFDGNYGYGVGLDDITLGEMVGIGTWIEVPANDSPANLSNLTLDTKYEVVVVPSCSEESASEPVFFTTRSANDKIFAVEGEWNEASNWIPEGVPTINQTVELRANTTITGEAFAKSISQGNYTITIEDGAKLKHLNSGVVATVKKNISGYENYTGENNGGYYLIANPMTSSVTPSADNGFRIGNFDLYNWNYNDINNEDNEWINFEAPNSSFTSLNSGAYGYLYANETGTTLTYTGTINAYTGNKGRSASVATNPDSYDFPSWYLFGNPYLYDAYLTNGSTNGTAMAYYRMNEAGDRIVPATAGTPIAPMEGFFYQGVTGATYVYVVTYEPAIASEAKLLMTVSKGRSTEDNAIIVFGGNQSLGKMSFRKGSTKLYMPVDNKDYAIVSTESNVGEMPVSFKAESNGSYSLNFTSQEVSFSYLHLIDNMTGNDVNLLETPYYTFNAQTTDYANRFRLVFATGSSAENDNFGFVNAAGNLCIFGIEGEATLQVVDVLGHVVSSNQFSGSYEQKLNVAPGVYMLRLINGNDVKVQKMVIR